MTLGVALSGGPDSVSLLLLAAHAFPDQVMAATVDHGLRDASASEARLCHRLCEALGVPHATLEVTVGDGNLQARARAARYAALARWAVDVEVDAVLTAHHADDQAETLLMRLGRGSGVDGLAGVRAAAVVPGTQIALLRPLLGWRKDELEHIVKDAGVETVRDPSNADARFDRARVRSALADADWLDVLALAASAGHLADAAAAIAWAAEREYDECVEQGSGFVMYRPRAPFAVRLKVLSRIAAEFGDAPRGGALATLVRGLGAGERANIAGVLIERRTDHWRVAKEPPRS